MPTTTVQTAGVYPNGVSVKAFSMAAEPYARAGIAPLSDVTATQTVTVSSLQAAFSGLTTGIKYALYGLVTNTSVSVTAAGGVGVDQTDVVTIGGVHGRSLSGGTFTLSVNVAAGGAQTTAALPYDASAADVQLALEALSNLAPGDVVVTGSRGGPWTLTYGGTVAATAIVTTVSGTNLTGGAEHRWTHVSGA